MIKAETVFKEAFERLKNNTPLILPRGTKISQNNVAKEAGKHPTALKKDRFPLLILEIQDFLKQHDIDAEINNNKKQQRKHRTLVARLNDCKKQRDKLVSICQAQATLIDELRYELSDYENGVLKPTSILLSEL